MNRIHFLLVPLLCFLASGCVDDGPKLYPVTGKVLFADGSNAQFGVMESRSDGVPRSIGRAVIKNDGTFTFKTSGRNGLVPGRHHLLIQQDVSRTKRGVVHNHGLEADTRYRTYETSDLKIDIDPEAENYFELTVDSR